MDPASEMQGPLISVIELNTHFFPPLQFVLVTFC